jgi:VanZ family protein
MPGARARASLLLPPLALAALIFGLSSIPGGGSGGPFPGADKLAHFAVYLVLGLLTARALFGLPIPHPALWSVGLCLLYGLSDEWHQSFVPGRDASWADVLADLAGAGAGVWLWSRRATRFSSRSHR